MLLNANVIIIFLPDILGVTKMEEYTQEELFHMKNKFVLYEEQRNFKVI